MCVCVYKIYGERGRKHTTETIKRKTNFFLAHSLKLFIINNILYILSEIILSIYKPKNIYISSFIT